MFIKASYEAYQGFRGSAVQGFGFGFEVHDVLASEGVGCTVQGLLSLNIRAVDLFSPSEFTVLHAMQELFVQVSRMRSRPVFVKITQHKHPNAGPLISEHGVLNSQIVGLL